jgi:Secretion system C-terminal sorting domain/SdrD B-like domain
MTAKNIIFIGILLLFSPFILRGQQNNAQLGKTTTGNASTLSGKVFYDQNKNEQFDNEPSLKKWFVKAVNIETGQTYLTATSETGQYQFELGLGTYKINIITPNRYWLPFQQDAHTTFKALDSEAILDFAVKSATLSPAMQVDIRAGNFQSCTENIYTVRYANNGTSVAQNAFINLNLDESLEFVGATQPLATQNGSVLRFDLGDIPANGFGSFTVKAKETCRETSVLAQNLCTNARIFPDAVSDAPVLGITQNWSVVQSNGSTARYNKNQIITEDVIIFMMPVNPDMPVGNNSDSLNTKKTDPNLLNRESNPVDNRPYQTAYFGNYPQNVATPHIYQLCHSMQIKAQSPIINPNIGTTRKLDGGVVVYPNPIREIGVFEIVGNTKNKAHLLLFDGLGQLVYQEKFEGNQVVLQRKNLVTGLYFYKIMDGNTPLSIGKVLIGEKW